MGEAVQSAGSLAHALFQLHFLGPEALSKPGNPNCLTADERCWSQALLGCCRNAFKEIKRLFHNINFLQQMSDNHFPVFYMHVRNVAA